MAEPARPRRDRPVEQARTPALEEPDGRISTFLRYVEGPDGHLELQEFPLTPEDFLDPQIGDTMVQGNLHNVAVIFLYDLLVRWFHGRPDVIVVSDLKHLMAPRRGPAPDVSVLMGLEEIDHEMESYNLAESKVPPSLIIEVVSPLDRRIREVDEKVKPRLYERIGVREYLLHDLPRRGNGWRAGWKGYRMDAAGRYQPIEPDTRGRFFSETAGLLFGVNPAGNWAELIDAETGERLLTPREEQEGRLRAEEECRQETEKRRRAEEGRRMEAKARKVAEEQVSREAEARKAAEAEVARLREELKKLRGES